MNTDTDVLAKDCGNPNRVFNSLMAFRAPSTREVRIFTDSSRTSVNNGNNHMGYLDIR